MKGDFTRGFNPDTKRGKRYRRVLLQQGRALLDSDMTALSDALETSLRSNLRMTTCHAGSPDLGLLVTPGRILAQFDGTLGNRFAAVGTATAQRDYSHKYLGRLPGLRIGGMGGTVTITLLQALNAPTAIRLWARADNGGSSPQVNGTAINVPSGANYAAVDVTTSGAELVITPDPASRTWIALIETRQNASTTPALHSHAGTYEVDGLSFPVSGGAWPSLPNPAGTALQAAATAPNNTRLLVYTEVWERQVTALHDPGIRETALGGDIDTTTRTEVRHQVKLARITGLPPDRVARAFATKLLPDGTVTLGVANETVTTDPCDLPVTGGYTGPENRLYRLEVHGQSTGGATLFKWSRENGSELFACKFLEDLAIGDPAASLMVNAEAHLQDGDLVELLSDAIELGDDAPATLSSSGFTRPQRAVGRLLRLSGGDEISGTSRVFDLLDPLDETPVTDVDSGRFGTAGLKLRHWSGLVRVTADGTYELEQGIEAVIVGRFEPGDWWQYEARVNTANANGPVQPAPHGPERLFAPLAVMRQTPANQPMLLERWLDSRFPRLCEIEADDVSYDGERVGSDSNTVQEALDELFETQTGDGCGEIPVPPGGDIRDIIDAIPNGGDAKICLGPGTRQVPSAIEVFDKGHITITGIGLGSVLEVGRPLFHFRNCTGVTLIDFSVRARGGDGSILRIEDCAHVDVQRLTISADGDASQSAAAIRLHATRDGRIRRGRVRDCRMSLAQNDTGVLAIGVLDMAVTDCDIEVPESRFDLRARIRDNAFASLVGRVFLSQLSFYVDDENFVGGADVSYGIGEPGRQGIALASWGGIAVRFSTHSGLRSDIWDRFSEANLPPITPATEPHMRAHIRRIRRGIARFGIGFRSPEIRMPRADASVFRVIGTQIADSADLAFGHAGIIVSAPRGPVHNGLDNINFLMSADNGQSVRINGNRIDGFTQGIRIGGDGRKTQNIDTRRTLFRDVEVGENRIDLRVPMFARSRWGIMLGSSLSAAVRNNRVAMPYEGHENFLPAPTDGIRLWGLFGAFVQVERNACFGTTHGVRFHALNPQTDPSRTIWKVSDFTNGQPVPTNSYFGPGGLAEIVQIP